MSLLVNVTLQYYLKYTAFYYETLLSKFIFKRTQV